VMCFLSFPPAFIPSKPPDCKQSDPQSVGRRPEDSSLRNQTRLTTLKVLKTQMKREKVNWIIDVRELSRI